jgi:hypothetical protein
VREALEEEHLHAGGSVAEDDDGRGVALDR